MHITEMARLVRHHPARQPAATSEPRVPVAMHITLDTAVARPAQLLAGVKRIKETAWYRALRKRGLHFVPLHYQSGVIVVAVGTSASLGLAYLAYKRLKERQRGRNPADPGAVC